MRSTRLRMRVGSGLSALVAGAMATGAVVAFGAVPPASAATSHSKAAASGSIVYLKNGRVWIAHPNGTHARQFTLHAFNWSSPSEARFSVVGRSRAFWSLLPS